MPTRIGPRLSHLVAITDPLHSGAVPSKRRATEIVTVGATAFLRHSLPRLLSCGRPGGGGPMSTRAVNSCERRCPVPCNLDHRSPGITRVVQVYGTVWLSEPSQLSEPSRRAARRRLRLGSPGNIGARRRGGSDMWDETRDGSDRKRFRSGTSGRDNQPESVSFASPSGAVLTPVSAFSPTPARSADKGSYVN